jgi:hypothetical protein
MDKEERKTKDYMVTEVSGSRWAGLGPRSVMAVVMDEGDGGTAAAAGSDGDGGGGAAAAREAARCR